MAEGSFAQAHSSLLRLVLLGASLAVAWAVVGAIASPSSASATEADSDTGSLTALGDVVEVLPVVGADEPVAAEAPAETTAAPVASVTEAAASVAVPVAPIVPVAELTAPVETLTTDVGHGTDHVLGTVVETATGVTGGPTGLVGTVATPLLGTLSSTGALLTSRTPIALPSAVAVAPPAPAAVAAPAVTAPTRAASHAAAAVADTAAAPHGAPLPSSPLAPIEAALLPVSPGSTAGSGGANGIPTVAAETRFGIPTAPATGDLPLLSPHETPPAPAPSTLDSPPD